MAALNPSFGIDKMRFDAGTLRLPLARLAAARGRDPAHPEASLGVRSRSLIPWWEDAVTLAVNAAKDLMTTEERDSVRLLIVGSESSFDNEKCLATWVHRYLELPPSCRSFEIKGACFAGTAGLISAASLLASGALPKGSRALVISADHSQAHFNQPQELGLGAGAAAVLVSENPRIAEIEWGRFGSATLDSSCLLRPTMTTEVGDFQSSLFSYLETLDETVRAYGADEPFAQFDRLLFHAPFAGMPRIAFRHHMRALGRATDAEIESQAREKIDPALRFARETGSTYGASTFYGLSSLIESGCRQGRVGVFAYGAGSHGEFYGLRLTSPTSDLAGSTCLAEDLAARFEVTVEKYERSERRRLSLVGLETAAIDPREWREVFESRYEGRCRLVLDRIDGYHRSYRWS